MTTSWPMHFLVVVFAGWLNRQQQAVIEYLKTENEILKSQLKGRRLRLTDEERRRLAVKGRALGRKVLAEGRVHRDAGHHSGMASPAGGFEVDLSSTDIGTSGTSADCGPDAGANCGVGAQRFQLGLQQHPGWAGEFGPSS